MRGGSKCDVQLIQPRLVKEQHHAPNNTSHAAVPPSGGPGSSNLMASSGLSATICFAEGPCIAVSLSELSGVLGIIKQVVAFDKKKESFDGEAQGRDLEE
ncbi:hypothetical protein HBI56_226440 [Parastagonospora nodorum]|nr:hypothetical protein HBH56_227350 [Parastagonospora nodorum]KAH3921675.1 hypothetical protein HBH54_235450 [Parastagonospora nodorum]KAH3939498.1 hypothetical protein HBH53_233290 [Parastagonospora nodorum]KAH3959060.1 hypothetical protein HBH51_203160 [Parastagonospora nodorum]KAH3963590.1 hypothetical protein HBH52_217480 [Parastagonospora nodorum]